MVGNTNVLILPIDIAPNIVLTTTNNFDHNLCVSVSVSVVELAGEVYATNWLLHRVLLALL